MASGAASTCGASQLVTSASPTGGSFQAPSDAPRVEHAQERRQALNGECYTMEEFREYYENLDGGCSDWTWYWNQAVLETSCMETAPSGSEQSDSLTGDASQPATGASATGGASLAPSGARLVELGQERQQAHDCRLCQVVQAVPIPSPSAPSLDCPVCHGPPDLTSSDVPCPKCRGLTTDSAVAPVSFGRQLNSLLHLRGFSDHLVLKLPI